VADKNTTLRDSVTAVVRLRFSKRTKLHSPNEPMLYQLIGQLIATHTE